jgi:hypothetical protein
MLEQLLLPSMKLVAIKVFPAQQLFQLSVSTLIGLRNNTGFIFG